MLNNLCLHIDTDLRWQPRGVDVVCRECGLNTFVGRTKLLAYGRQLLTQQLNAKEVLRSIFTQSMDSGNDVQVTTFTDNAKPVAFRGLVQTVDEDQVKLTVDHRGSVQWAVIHYRDILNAVEIIPEVGAADTSAVQTGEATDGGDKSSVSDDELGEVQASGI